MHLLEFCINFMGLIGCYSNQSHRDAKSLGANFLETNYLAKLPAELKEKTFSA